MQHVRRTGFSLKTRWVLSNVVKSCNKFDSLLEYVPSRSLSDVGIGRFPSMAAENAVFNVSAERELVRSGCARRSVCGFYPAAKVIDEPAGIPFLYRNRRSTQCLMAFRSPFQLVNTAGINPQSSCFARSFASKASGSRQKQSEEALKFLGQLTTCMGKNTEFCIEHIYEGTNLTIVVNWHLEWNKKQVPFTRGCSCYELSRDGDQELVIKKAQVIFESPIKPGSFALEVFQKVISVCDAFPEAAEWLFLMSPHLLPSIYDIALQPSIRPILACYRKLWSLIVAFLTLIYTIFMFIIKKFHE